ncbi:MAG TPA: sugar-transfer associated ATP-grasp domain-containing protein [Tissierellales bacterium]|nr:sugar-transfer associated ATP-grasp domain-containing protein [Tissierellales bacterium]
MKDLSQIEKKYYSLSSRLGIIRREIKSKKPIDHSNCLKMWMRGFSSDKYNLYNLEENDYKDYFPDCGITMTRFINYPYDIVLDNKIMFEEMFSQHIRVPKNYALIEKGVIKPLQSKIKIDTIGSILKVCKEEGGLVVKPVIGSKGRGVTIYKIKNDTIYMNNRKISKIEFEESLKSFDDYIVTEFVKQGEYPKRLYPGSTNTIRILILVDPETKEPFVAAATQRVGTKKTGGLDNFSAGGCNAGVDIDTGVLTSVASWSKSNALSWGEKHPESNVQITGVKIPHWDDIKNKLIDTMKKMPYFKQIGWDVLLTDDDIVVIEANSMPGSRVIQVHRPLLTNPKVRKYYEYYDII